MAISIDWTTGVISIPQADLSFISGTLYSLDTNVFWDDLKALEYGEEGIPWEDTQSRTAAITIAGVVYVPGIIILSPYTITFEDGQYAVRLDGTNNNIFDEGIINRNQVSIIPTNSAGLQQITSGSGLSASEQAQLSDMWRRFGLDAAAPLTFTDTTIVVGGITIDITQPDANTTVVTRQ